MFFFLFAGIKFSLMKGIIYIYIYFCSIGSLGARGETDIVEDVHVKNCTLTETLTGVRIKTKQVIKQILTNNG